MHSLPRKCDYEVLIRVFRLVLGFDYFQFKASNLDCHGSP